MVNGVALADNVRGTPYNLYIEDAIQETTVAIAGVSAEYGRFGGGLVNVITKSGGNLFAGSFRETLNDDNWRTLTPFETTNMAADPKHTDPRLAKVVPEHRVLLQRARPQGQALVLHGRSDSVTGEQPHPPRDEHRLSVYRRDAAVRGEGHLFGHGETPFPGGLPQDHPDPEELHLQPRHLDGHAEPGRSRPARDTCHIQLQRRAERQAVCRRRDIRVADSAFSTTAQSRPTLFRVRFSSTRQTRDDTGRTPSAASAGPSCGTTTTSTSKGSYFLSKKSSGSHNVTFGYDNFNDIRNANNHQSGSDYRILGTFRLHPAQRRCRPAVPGQQHDDHPVQPAAIGEPGVQLPDAFGVSERRLARQRSRDGEPRPAVGQEPRARPGRRR